MKKYGKIIITIFCIAAIFGTLITFTGGCNKEKKAMILIPGICGSAFYDADTGEPVYALDLIEINQLLGMLHDPDEMVNQMSLDEDGVPLSNLRPATMDDPIGKYTMLSMFEPLYTALNNEYGDDYDVVIWQYDWRVDNIQTAAKLEQFIADNGYDKVMFFTHSMGGNIVSQYLANSEANRDKVELFVPFSTPFFGSNDAYYFQLDGLISNLGGLMNSIPTEDGRVDFSNAYNMFASSAVMAIKPMLQTLGQNLPSMVLLTPFEQYWNDPLYAEGQTPVSVDGTYLTYEQALEYFKSLSSSKKADETLKPSYLMIDAYQAGHMVLIDGELKHISALVNTYYIAGSGVNTLKSFNINSATNTIISTSGYSNGDGLVSVYSSIAGNSVDADNVFIMNGSSHISVVTDEQSITTAMQIVANYLG